MEGVGKVDEVVKTVFLSGLGMAYNIHCNYNFQNYCFWHSEQTEDKNK